MDGLAGKLKPNRALVVPVPSLSRNHREMGSYRTNQGLLSGFGFLIKRSCQLLPGTNFNWLKSVHSFVLLAVGHCHGGLRCRAEDLWGSRVTSSRNQKLACRAAGLNEAIDIRPWVSNKKQSMEFLTRPHCNPHRNCQQAETITTWVLRCVSLIIGFPARENFTTP